jgi:hypothetical protein
MTAGSRTTPDECAQLRLQLRTLNAQLQEDIQHLQQLQDQHGSAQEIAEWEEVVRLKSEEVDSARRQWVAAGCDQPPGPRPNPPPVFTEIGPGAILDSNEKIVGTGAVVDIAAHPTDPAVIYAATAGGGVWRTLDAAVGNLVPSWEPLTDFLPSTAMGSVAFGRGDPSHQTLFVGTGCFSSFCSTGPAVGLYTTSGLGGSGWRIAGATLAPLRIRVVTPLSPPNQAVVLAAAYAPNIGGGGIYRSTDGGETFGTASLVPAGDGWSIVEDPGNPGRVYAAFGGAAVAAIYRSDDAGATWHPAGTGIAAADLGGAVWIRLELRPGQAGAASTLYAGIVTHTGRGSYGGNQFSALYTTAASPGQEAWTPVPLPPGGGDAINPLGEGNAKFAIAADPAHPMLFAGGDQEGVWRADVTDPARPVWLQISKAAQYAGANVPDDAPHDDTQALVFDAAGNLLVANDGGVYRLIGPSGPAPTWVHLGRTMRNNEVFAVAYDTLSGVAVIGSADDGVSAQASPGATSWRYFYWGDVFEADVDNSAATFSWRYLNSDNTLYRYQFDVANGAGGHTPPGGTPPGGQLPLAGLDSAETGVTFALNTAAADRLLFGGIDVYESIDGGATVTKVLTRPSGVTGGVRMVCGGVENGTAHPEVAYVAFGSQLWLRPAGSSQFSRISAYPGTSQIACIAVDRLDWRRVCVADSDHVFRTEDVTDPPRIPRPPQPLPTHPGHPWIDCTGNLLGLITDGQLEGSVMLIHRTSTASAEAVLLGTLGGVFRTLNAAGGATATWRRFGTNLPRCAANGLRYYPAQTRVGGTAFGDVLLVGLQGRGAWLLPNAGPRLLFPDPAGLPSQMREVPPGTSLWGQRIEYEGLGLRQSLRPG